MTLDSCPRSIGEKRGGCFGEQAIAKGKVLPLTRPRPRVRGEKPALFVTSLGLRLLIVLSSIGTQLGTKERKDARRLTLAEAEGKQDMDKPMQ